MWMILVWVMHLCEWYTHKLYRLMWVMQTHVSDRLMWMILMWVMQAHVSDTDSCEWYRLMWVMKSHVSDAGSCEWYSYEWCRLMWVIQTHVSDAGSRFHLLYIYLNHLEHKALTCIIFLVIMFIKIHNYFKIIIIMRGW